MYRFNKVELKCLHMHTHHPGSGGVASIMSVMRSQCPLLYWELILALLPF